MCGKFSRIFFLSEKIPTQNLIFPILTIQLSCTATALYPSPTRFFRYYCTQIAFLGRKLMMMMMIKQINARVSVHKNVPRAVFLNVFKASVSRSRLINHRVSWKFMRAFFCDIELFPMLELCSRMSLQEHDVQFLIQFLKFRNLCSRNSHRKPLHRTLQHLRV